MSWDLSKIALVVSLLLFTGLFWWLPNTLVTPAMKFTGIQSRDPDYYIENFRMTAMSDRGRPKYTLQAANLVHFPNETATRMERPHLVQYDPDQAPDQATVTIADNGWISSDGKRLRMNGNVKVFRGENPESAAAELTTNELIVILN